jgi:cyclase
MLKFRIIPTLLYKDFGLVKGIGFNSSRRVGAVLPAIRLYNQRDIDELIFLDIRANSGQSCIDLDLIKDISKNCFVPLTVGGGIDSCEKVEALLMSGADKISLNTAAYANPKLITQIANRYGSQCIIVSIDARKIDHKKWSCYSHSGSTLTHKEVATWAKEVENSGAGEILLTSIDFDGSMKGYDLDLIKIVCETVNIPVIASGGASNYKDMVLAISSCGASAVAAGSIFHFTEQTPLSLKTDLFNSGIPTRIHL